MNKCCTINYRSKKLVPLANYLQIISEPNRLKIICLLSSGTKCVCEIEKALRINQNLVSHHLKILREAGMVKATKKGFWKHYSLNKTSIKTLYKSLKEVMHV